MSKLLDKYNMRIPLYRSLMESLENEFGEMLEGKAKIDRIKFRVKEAESFIKKSNAPPKYENPIAEVEDQIGGRVIVVYKSDVDIIVKEIKKNFNAIEFTERRPPRDAEFGYESSHLILSIPPHLWPEGWSDIGDVPVTFEVQVRTLFMHAWAEPSHGLEYKNTSELPKELLRELSWVAASAWGADQALDRIRKKINENSKSA
jgi:putative GTP pyrophosphokinase